MRIVRLCAALFWVLLPSAPASEQPAESRIMMRMLRKDATSQERPRPRIFELAGKRIETVEDFKAAVLALPRGTELVWDSGCLIFETLPVAGPQATLAELQQFCAAHGVVFTYGPSGVRF